MTKFREKVTQNPDGSSTVTTSFQLPSQLRPVNDAAVEALDAALGALGKNVLHAMDPRRLVSFRDGGPPVWSVGMVSVPGPTPYTLLVTYGFSHALSPEDFRRSVRHEYSLAVPADVPTAPWADALLRHMCRYVLTQGADIKVADCVPFFGTPITCIPFQPEHHAMMPPTKLVGVMADVDPVLPQVKTPHGTVEIRRIVGVDQRELDRAETWSFRGFLDELRRVNPLLLSPPGRRSAMDDDAFRFAVDRRAASEGSDVDAAAFAIGWARTANGVRLTLPPRGPASQRLLNGLRGRLGFGRPLVAYCANGTFIRFVLGAPGVGGSRRELVLSSEEGAGALPALLSALEAGAPHLDLPAT